MDWALFLEQAKEVASVTLGFVGTLAALFGGIEIIFRPFRSWKEKRDDEQKTRERLIKLLGETETHYKEAQERNRRLDMLEEKVEEHEQAIEQSREERRILWQAMRTMMLTLRDIIPVEHRETRQEITKSVQEMDKYANDHMRGK